MMRRLPLSLLLLAALVAPAPAQDASPFRTALDRGRRALDAGDMENARRLVQRALERDPKSREAWSLFAQWAELAGEQDLLVYARHQEFRRAVAEGKKGTELVELRAGLELLDPLSRDLYALRDRFLERLEALAKSYEKAGRPHSAIRVHKEVLALDPQRESSSQAIEALASGNDASLAADAKPRDLFADIDAEWIAEHDAEHDQWKQAAREERDNYVTVTDAGYEVLLRTAEAMEQMSAFYREFFQYGGAGDDRKVPRIEVRIFKNRDEYLKLGEGPPVEWSGGHFIGHAVETYIDSSFEGTVGTLFHEAAHQFVSLATNSVGWLNEGLASFFEGTRILPNGAVIMNLPAVHRLIPLATRMERGWMADATDGISATEASQTPETAPTFRIVLENRYAWGPPWYAPTWGVVYFLYNFQDPADGRFVYRDAFREYVDKSGGKMGDTAVKTFEEVVLGQPKPPYGKRKSRDAGDLPRDVEELNELWKEWIVGLRDEVEGRSKVDKPYLDWGLAAMEGGDTAVAREHFERGLVSLPRDVPIRLAYADLLQKSNPDRTVRLLEEALTFLEARGDVDENELRDVERRLDKLDPNRESLAKLHGDLEAALGALADRYAAAGLDRMVMDVTWRGALELSLEGLLDDYESALRRTGESLAIWELAYNEVDLEGWVAPGSDFRADGPSVAASYGEYDEDRFDYRVLTLDRLTAGDFSLDAQVLADRGAVNFCGFVFGFKSGGSFHAAVFFPPRTGAGRSATTGYVDLASWRGAGVAPRTWLHSPVQIDELEVGETAADRWLRLRVDVIGADVDVWFEGRPVGTWHFPSRDVLQGSFGLLLGPGACRFREVRFLSRDPRDPASQVERALRLEALGITGDGPVDGSYMDRVPPFPSVQRWVTGARDGWSDGRFGPQLLTFWSVDQNERIPIDAWLRSLEQRYAPLGMRFVSIASTFDDARLDAYLEKHPFPGAVGVDRPSKDGGIGQAFEQYSIGRFHMPRILLIDVDGRVAWEGDPGFTLAEPARPPYGSYLDDPLGELLGRRNLAQVGEWRRRWDEVGRPALERNDLATAAPIMREAVDLERSRVPEVVRVAALTQAIERSLQDIEGTLGSLARDGAEPALQVLVEWGATFAPELDRDAERAVKRATKEATSSPNGGDWRKAVALAGKYARAKVGYDELHAELAKLSGALVEQLAAELAVPELEPEEIEERVQGVPARWLLADFFGYVPE